MERRFQLFACTRCASAGSGGAFLCPAFDGFHHECSSYTSTQSRYLTASRVVLGGDECLVLGMRDATGASHLRHTCPSLPRLRRASRTAKRWSSSAVTAQFDPDQDHAPWCAFPSNTQASRTRWKTHERGSCHHVPPLASTRKPSHSSVTTAILHDAAQHDQPYSSRQRNESDPNSKRPSIHPFPTARGSGRRGARSAEPMDGHGRLAGKRVALALFGSIGTGVFMQERAPGNLTLSHARGIFGGGAGGR